LEDLTEAEKKAELLPIIVQQVYILIQLGKVDEAEELCINIPFAEYVLLEDKVFLPGN